MRWQRSECEPWINASPSILMDFGREKELFHLCELRRHGLPWKGSYRYNEMLRSDSTRSPTFLEEALGKEKQGIVDLIKGFLRTPGQQL